MIFCASEVLRTAITNTLFKSVGHKIHVSLKICFSHSYRTSWYYQSFIYTPTDALVSCIKNNIKIYVKIYIKTAPTCFDVTVTPSSGSALICAY